MSIIALFCFLFTNTQGLAEDSKAGEVLYQKCIQCHGKEGQGDAAQGAPKLAGQYAWYLETQLKSFKNKVRSNPKMEPFLAGLTEANFKDLAAYISNLK